VPKITGIKVPESPPVISPGIRVVGCFKLF